MSKAEVNIPSLVSSGRFFVGCNYWASHAGTHMWRDWQPSVVADDLRQLAAEGLQTLRVFPLWSDFQPVEQLFGCQGAEIEVRHGDTPLPSDLIGQAGLDSEMISRFRILCDIAHDNGLSIVVGLLTGWMSGRLFVPQALAHRNLMTDPVALMWQVRFVRAFVNSLKDHPAITAWDLGNECNCMGRADTPEQAYVWSALVANTIRAADSSRAIISGMHGLEPAARACWRIQDQAEVTDILTTHPYPVFTPHCGQDPLDEFRNGLHATAQTCWYADIGGAPAIVEEMGTLGPMVCDDDTAARYLRSSIASLWAHDCKAMLWWCAYDQDHLQAPPYDWSAFERELGMFRVNREPKPLVKEVAAFRAMLKSMPFETLPARVTEAVCLLTEGQDSWGAAYSAFALAKQAGFDLRFQFVGQPLMDSKLYIVPSVVGANPISRRQWLELLGKVEAGATLYVSAGDAALHPFNSAFGVKVCSRVAGSQPVTFTVPSISGNPTITGASRVRFRMESTGATILASASDGDPVFTCNRLGKGLAYYLDIPIEMELAARPGAFHAAGADPAWEIYRLLAAPHMDSRVIVKDSPVIGVTEHPISDVSRVAILINYGRAPATTRLSIKHGWRIEKVVDSTKLTDSVCRLEGNSTAVLLLATCDSTAKGN